MILRGHRTKESRNMTKGACTAPVVVASPSQSEREGAEDDVSLEQSDSSQTQNNLWLPFPGPSLSERTVTLWEPIAWKIEAPYGQGAFP